MPHDLLAPYFCGLGPWGLGCVTRDESTNLSELWRPRFRKAENAGCCEDAMAVVTEGPAPLALLGDPGLGPSTVRRGAPSSQAPDGVFGEGGGRGARGPGIDKMLRAGPSPAGRPGTQLATAWVLGVGSLGRGVGTGHTPLTAPGGDTLTLLHQPVKGHRPPRPGPLDFRTTRRGQGTGAEVFLAPVLGLPSMAPVLLPRLRGLEAA